MHGTDSPARLLPRGRGQACRVNGYGGGGGGGGGGLAEVKGEEKGGGGGGGGGGRGFLWR